MHNGDAYGGYNKPEAVREWLEHVEPESDTVRWLLHDGVPLSVLPLLCYRYTTAPPGSGELPSQHARAQVLILDTDLIIRTPFLPAQLHVRHGFARSAEFGYMKGAACLGTDDTRNLPDVLNRRRPAPGGPHLDAPIRTMHAGVNNDLALRHIPEVAPKEDKLAGPFGRRSDQVSTFAPIYKVTMERKLRLLHVRSH